MNRSKLNKLFSLIRWEFMRNLRFPILEFIFVSAVYSIVSGLLNISSVLNVDIKSIGVLIYNIFAVEFIFRLGLCFVSKYDLIIAVYSILASISFAGEIASGNIRLLLSYPLKRRDIFFIKCLCLFFIPYTIYLGVSLFFLLLMGQDVILYLSWHKFIIALFILFIESLYVFSISVAVSLLLQNTMASFLSTLLILYGLEKISFVLPSSIKIFVPPENLRIYVFHVLGRVFPSQYNSTLLFYSFINMLVLSLLLLFASYLYFVRVYEVCRRG